MSLSSSSCLFLFLCQNVACKLCRSLWQEIIFLWLQLYWTVHLHFLFHHLLHPSHSGLLWISWDRPDLSLLSLFLFTDKLLSLSAFPWDWPKAHFTSTFGSLMESSTAELDSSIDQFWQVFHLPSVPILVGYLFLHMLSTHLSKESTLLVSHREDCFLQPLFSA